MFAIRCSLPAALVTAVTTALVGGTLGALPAQAAAIPTPVLFSASGTHDWTVPTAVTRVSIEAVGGAGGSALGGFAGGAGARVTATLPVTPGSVLHVYVAGSGNGATPGFNGGRGSEMGVYGGGSGGASDVRLDGSSLTDRVLVAAGAGGGGIGAQGADAAQDGFAEGSCTVATAGSATAGGVGGTRCGSGSDAGSGSLGLGGLGDGWNGGGGGAGLYGGGGGSTGGGGAGGSNFVTPSATQVTTGVAPGVAPRVQLTYGLPAPAPLPTPTPTTHTPDSYVRGAALHAGRFQVRGGQSYTIVTRTSSRTAPRFLGRVALPHAHKPGRAFHASGTRAGQHVWTIKVLVPARLARHPLRAFAIRVGATEHQVRLYVAPRRG